MEINGISPLPHFYEEIYTNQVGIKKLGLRGDENYLFYSVNGLGSGYYEKHEMELAAKSVYRYFKVKQNRKEFIKKINELLRDLQIFTDMVDEEDFSKFSDRQIAQYFVDANRMHGRAFSLYIVSQPYRMAEIERDLKTKLRKRVAASRIDSYMAELATSEKPTKVTREELDWLRFLIKYKKKYGDTLKPASLERDRPDMYKDLERHFDKYKSLTLGDGNWSYDIKHYINNLKNDYPKSIESLEGALKLRTEYPFKVKQRRDQLIKELYLHHQSVEDCAFLADIGHTRLVMRIEGWLPFVSTIIKLDIELSKRLGYGDILNYATEEEFLEFISTGTMVSEKELLARKGKKQEFLILHDHGKYKLFYGADAGKKFRSLVDKVDHDSIKELKGSTAVMGVVRGKACVYRWDDNLEKKLKIIKKYPILIAGQTRPSMMPIIRLAKGIVTDEGGVTSHAAIVSRELGIPAVIGTIHATKVFKDGDLVEIDADNGIVKKLT
jgi:phosphohistidine swiveling domain-containing protein